MPKSDKKTKTEASRTNSTKKNKDKKKRTPTRSTDRTGKEPSTPEKKNKRSKSKSPCKGTPPPTGGRGKYRDKTSPEDTPSSARSRGPIKSLQRSPLKRTSTTKPFSSKTPPKRSSTSTTSPKRRSSQSPSGPRRVRNKMNALSLEAKVTSDITEAPKKTEEEDTGVEKGAKPAPNHIDWMSTEEVDKALKHFHPTSEWQELPHDEKVGMLAGCYTPSEIKPTYLCYMTLMGVEPRHVNLAELKNRKVTAKAMSDTVVKVMNKTVHVGCTG